MRLLKIWFRIADVTAFLVGFIFAMSAISAWVIGPVELVRLGISVSPFTLAMLMCVDLCAVFGAYFWVRRRLLLACLMLAPCLFPLSAGAFEPRVLKGVFSYAVFVVVVFCGPLLLSYFEMKRASSRAEI